MYVIKVINVYIKTFIHTSYNMFLSINDDINITNNMFMHNIDDITR